MSSTVNIPNNYGYTIGGGLAISVAPVTLNANTKVTGDPSSPVASLVTGDPSKPVTSLMTGDPNKPITTLLKGDPNNPVATLLTGDPKKPIATSVELLNLPRFTLADIKELAIPKLRVRMPNYTQLCFKILGVEMFSFCLSGEAQTITEPYIPNSKERCEDQCCEPDRRPFPGRNNQGVTIDNVSTADGPSS